MKKIFLLIIIICLISISASARAKLSGIAGKGGKDVKTSTTITYQLLETYPLCTVTVYLTGTTTIASIYSDNAGTVKANPFSSSSIDASWFFYADNGRYDIKFSGTGITSPYTLADYLFTDNVVIGPSSATDNAIARFDGTTGKLIQNSVVTISDVGNIDSTTGKTFTFGDSTATDSARQIFRTQSTDIWHNSALTSNFTNGTTCGLTNYKDQTFFIGYNSNSNGTKINSGLVNFGIAQESRFCQAPASSFQTEVYFTWIDPTNTKSIRPWGFVIDHSNGSVNNTMQGDINFFRQLVNGGGQTALWHENGGIDLSFLATGSITFKNNQSGTGGIRWLNAAGSNTLAPIYINNLDQTVIGVGGGGSDVLIIANNTSVRTILAEQLEHSTTPTTKIGFAFGNIMTLESGGNIVGVVRSDSFEIRKPLTCETDGSCVIGKNGGTNLRPSIFSKAIETDSQFTSTLSTGTAPLAITSTTPVANLTLTSHPQILNTSGALQVSNKIVSGIGTLSTGTVVITFTSSAVFANTSYICTGSNQTNLNPFKIVNTSASSITITGTGSDVIGFHCIGN